MALSKLPHLLWLPWCPFLVNWSQSQYHWAASLWWAVQLLLWRKLTLGICWKEQLHWLRCCSFLAFFSNLSLNFFMILAIVRLYLSLSFLNFSHLSTVFTITVIVLHLDGNLVGVWMALVPIVLAIVVLFPKIRTIEQLVIWILSLTFVAVYLLNSLSWHLRNWVLPRLMVGLSSCLSLGYPIYAPVDILHGGPRFLFLNDSSSYVAVSDSLDES